MSDNPNKLKKTNKRWYAMAIVLIGIVLIFSVTFVRMVKNGGWNSPKSVIVPQTKEVRNNSVVFEQPKLQVFDNTEFIDSYPDTIRIHYPYFIVSKPYETKSSIYNLEQKSRVKNIDQVVLDFAGTNLVTNPQGIKTYFNNTDLGVLCLSAYIKDSSHILCVKSVGNQSMNTTLVNIDTNTKTQQVVYTPAQPSIITSVAIINGIQYLGLLDINSMKNNLVIKNKVIPVEGSVDIIYPMNNQVYFASNKKANQNSSYWLVNQNETSFSVSKVGEGKILFY